MYPFKPLLISLLTAASALASEARAATCATNAAIYDIQGAGHFSPLAGQRVTTRGIVTARAFNGTHRCSTISL